MKYKSLFYHIETHLNFKTIIFIVRIIVANYITQLEGNICIYRANQSLHLTADAASELFRWPARA